MPSACDRHSPRVYVALLNWNGWGDTLECLESLFRSDYSDFQVIVCDNGSEDGSMDHLEAWAEGRVDIAGGCRDQRLARFSFPPAPKPIPYVVHGRGAAEAGGGGSDSSARLILIESGANLGFAGGYNIALRYALARDDFAYIWLLNNDTVVNGDALSAVGPSHARKAGCRHLRFHADVLSCARDDPGAGRGAVQQVAGDSYPDRRPSTCLDARGGGKGGEEDVLCQRRLDAGIPRVPA